MVPSPEPSLHVGDRLRLVCPEAPDLCVDRTIGPDGTVSVPQIGALAAATRSPDDLAREIETRLPVRDLPPKVEVRWLGPPAGEVAVEGAVRFPLRVFAPQGVSKDRLLEAARPTPDADLATRETSRRVRPGTTLLIESIRADRLITVLGAVATPRSLPPSDSASLTSALEAAGGLTPHGDPNAIAVVRNGEAIPVALPVDRGFLLQPGDVVKVGFVANRRYVTVNGGVVHPGKVEYAPGMTATQVVAAAGGLAPGIASGTLVWQTGPKTFRLSLAFLLRGRIPDPVLGANDTLTVEGRP